MSIATFYFQPIGCALNSPVECRIANIGMKGDMCKVHSEPVKVGSTAPG
jgi:hypothetical protein